MRVRTVLLVLAALLAVDLCLSAGLYWAMLQPPDAFGRVMMKVPMPAMMVVPFGPLWKSARRGKVEPGALAPDFRLPTLDRKQTVQLSSFRGSKPVVLVFGSYT